ncbi:mitochondrial protein [Rhodotorula toruloides]|uniref:Mitochondrial protein n=1 Tax=Rhodotorula toruloides TaxID=5286 RepID=A0A511KGC5_RHOTO|nr:mitochondrial protein [Rhodotorula toruloides]
MDRPHPLLDRIGAPHSPAPLRSTCLFILRLHWAAVTDVGDTPYDLIATLLPHSTAPQLLEIEANSPHIAQYTNRIWRDLCVHEFIEVRKAVEDGTLKREDEPASWREQYAEEEVKREAKMQAILSKMRGRYEDYKEGRASTQLVNGAAQERRRKAAHGPARSKTLFDKARSSAKGIKAIYAPKKRFSGIAPRPSPSAASPSAPPTNRFDHLFQSNFPGDVSSAILSLPLQFQATFARRTNTVFLAPASPSFPFHRDTCPTGGVALFISQRNELALDAEPGKTVWTDDDGREKVGKGDIRPEVFLWGRNTHGVASTSTSDSTQIKRPMAVPALSNLILRDLALSATYGVAVDSNGDVLQWGHGYGAPEQGGVEKTLTGKNLIKVVPTEEGKVFGLSKKGEVWVWASDKLAQRAGGANLSDLPKRVEESGWLWVLGKGTLWGRNDGGGVEVLKVHPDVKLEKGEKFTSLSAGASHLLALTSRGRSFALPLCLSANTHGQLGVRSVHLLSPPHPGSSASGDLTIRLEPDERLNEMGWEKLPPPPKKLDPLLLPPVSPPTPSNPMPKSDHVPPLPSPPPLASVQDEQAITLHPDPSRHAALERSIHFCTTLHEIPSLRGVHVAQLVAGKRHSLARLGGAMEGRVLGWGMNSYGQLGLGSSLSYPCIPAPTEIPLGRSPAYSGANRPISCKCTKLAAGGNVSYFVVETEKGVDLLASGQGQYGGLGNGLWAHATNPVRVKTVSGLREWSDRTNKVEFVGIKDVQAGEGHVAVVLDNAVSHADGSSYGRDVFVWGYNEHYQLGTGKRSNLPTPQHLRPLPYPGASPTVMAAASDNHSHESSLSSGTTSPMPHKRMQLSPSLPTPTHPPPPTYSRLPRGAIVEEAITAGDGGSGVYWRILNP